MTTQNKSGDGPAFDEAADRIRDLNERVIEASRKAGKAYLDAYETFLRGIADYQQKVADASRVEWFSALLNAQADFTHEVAKAATKTAREFLK
ncbi:MAG: hypothetical protein ICV69_15520 [Thermoleophilaceae bacterium]|nr:hypothetical protein [Thermoleophilaceae bacterium]